MAEETGVIIPMTQWVLRTACAQMKSWLRSGINLQTMSLNVSPRFFNDCNLPEMVGEVLRTTDLEGRYLSIELTESVMMGSTDATIDTLQQLKQYGLKISIDDFGTGYSSLSYLKRLPIDTLKIDQSFVRDIPNSPDAEAIAVLIIGMAHSLKLSVVAEGVETQDQKLFLQFKGCDIMQGYLVSRPLPTDEITSFLTSH
jgi:EAL domain-containing protein (putative c-di-GMP-specific phosphodiesterase class I)